MRYELDMCKGCACKGMCKRRKIHCIEYDVLYAAINKEEVKDNGY
jgi:hypothetical protein